MTVLAPRQGSIRLAGVFTLSLLAFGLIAAAALAALWIVEQERESPEAVAEFGVDANVDVPDGMVLIRKADAAAWEAELGFEPILADSLRDGAGEPLLYIEQPDAQGHRGGHVRYTTDDGVLVVLVEQAATLASEPELESGETSGTRWFLQSVGCGTVVIHAQLFFTTDGAPVASDREMADEAKSFIASLQEQCS